MTFVQRSTLQSNVAIRFKRLFFIEHFTLQTDTLLHQFSILLHCFTRANDAAITNM